MIELKPCPFCGKHNIIVDACEIGIDKNKPWFAQVFCGDCFGGISREYYRTEEEAKNSAIEAWNKRINNSKFESGCILRQDAIDILVKESNADGAYGYIDTKSIIDLLKGLPEVYPKRQKETWIGKFLSDIGYF